MQVTIFGNTYTCTRAERSGASAILYDGETIVASFEGVSDFSVFTLSGGAWTYPTAEEAIAATATMAGGLVTLDIGDRAVKTGSLVRFKAPCTCAAVTGGIVINGKTYQVCDAMGQCVTGVGGVWDSGAQVAVVLDKEEGKAFIQNGAASGGFVEMTQSITVEQRAKGKLYGLVLADYTGGEN